MREIWEEKIETIDFEVFRPRLRVECDHAAWRLSQKGSAATATATTATAATNRNPYCEPRYG
jgi:hypothetical protein